MGGWGNQTSETAFEVAQMVHIEDRIFKAAVHKHVRRTKGNYD